MRQGFLIALMLLLHASYAAGDFERDQIQRRISPVGQVRIQGERGLSSAEPTEKPVELVKKEPGQGTFESYCIVCHRDGVAGAPKFRVAAEWQPRLSQKKIDGLVQSATKGLNAMPPKGTCSECTDADLKAAIEYMLPRK